MELLLSLGTNSKTIQTKTQSINSLVWTFRISSMWILVMMFIGSSLGQDIKVDPYLQQRIQNMIDRQSPTDYISKEKFKDFANLYLISEEDEEEFRNFRNGNLTFIKFLIEV